MRARRSGWLAVFAVVVLFVIGRGVWVSKDNDPPPADAPRHYLVVDRAELLALPTSGTAWTAMLNVANGSLGTVDLANQDSLTAGRTVAAALVYARTGDVTYRDKVVAELEAVPTSSLATAKVLSVGRQLPGYVISADLVGYRDPEFVSFVSGIRTKFIGNHSRFLDITQTSERTASNWGAWARASRVAASLYVGDTADVARAAKVFKGFTGDRSAYAGFNKTPDFDPTWACNPAAWQPINPANCGDRSGAIVEDVSRSHGSYPAITDKGEMYSWGTLSAAMLTARMLALHGYPDVYTWSDNALLRAARFLVRHGSGPPDEKINNHVPWMVNQAYAVHLGPVTRASYGRSFGYTDWMRGR